MKSITNQALEPVIDNIDKAIQSHRFWVRSIMHTLVCDEEPSSNDLSESAHKLCKFGCWYYGPQPEELKHLQAYAVIGFHHKNLHVATAELLRKKISNVLISHEDLDDFFGHIDLFLNTLEQFRREVYTLLYNRDPLTGVFNRRSFDEELNKLQDLVNKDANLACIVILDLDYFKKINDSFGHTKGDEVLRQTAEVVQQKLRNIDKVFRYGGEEFVISLLHTSKVEAYQVAERIRESIASMNIVFEGNSVNVTASFGIAEVVSNIDVEQAVILADKALYKAKKNGRNRVEIFDC